MKDLGYQVKSFSDPLAALEEFRADPSLFDMVITDLTMPRMTGLDLAEKNDRGTQRHPRFAFIGIFRQGR